MARKKVKLAFIANDSTRRATFKKRKKGLMKKASELATLCDVKACVVVYGPQEKQPEVWPTVPEVARVLARFKSLPEMEQCKKMVTQEGFIRQRIAKTKEQLHRAAKENHELEMARLMYRCVTTKNLDGVDIEATTSLGWMAEMKIKQVRDRIERVQKELNAIGAVTAAAAANLATGAATVLEPPPPPPPLEATMEGFQRQNWMMESLNQNDSSLVFNNGDQEMFPGYFDHSNPWLDPAYFFSV